MKKFLFALWMLVAPAASWAQVEHYVVQDPDYQFEVTLDGEKNLANVEVLDAKKDLPKWMDVILYRDKKKPLTVTVRTVDVPKGRPTYTGALDLSQVSYTGVALQLNFNPKTKTLQGTKE